MTAEIVTANRLIDGAVVYLTDEGAWSEAIADARLSETGAETASLLDTAARDLADRKIVGPYAMKAEDSALGPWPLSQRERIRAAGPTIAFGCPRAGF